MTSPGESDSDAARDRAIGSLLGLAAGDAVGTTVEFKARGTFEPLTDMVGGGPFSLPAGAWTDDTSMALCLGESLLEMAGFDPRDQMERYVRWWREGHWSSTGRCFDIGMTVSGSLRRFQATGEPFAGPTAPDTAGNGSLMRLAPIAIRYRNDAEDLERMAALSSRTTHGAQTCVDACRLFARLLALAFTAESRGGLLEALPSWEFDPKLHSEIDRIRTSDIPSTPESRIRGSGYVVESLEAALWSFFTTASFEEAVLRAANLGDDADTTAAICGQIAGAHYGSSAIPSHWLERIVMREEIEEMAGHLFEAGR